MSETIAKVFEKETGETVVLTKFDMPKRIFFFSNYNTDKLSVRRINELFDRAKREFNCECFIESGKRDKIICGCE